MRKYILANLTIRAHAWCMDNANDKEKMATLIRDLMQETS